MHVLYMFHSFVEEPDHAYISDHYGAAVMAHDVQIHDRQQMQSTARMPPAHWPVLAFAFASIAFLAGAAVSLILRGQAWAWNAPASVACFVLAALCGGIALMSLVLAKSRDREADELLAEIRRSRTYARGLLARAEQNGNSSFERPKTF